VPGTVLLLGLRLGRPGLNSLPGLPDGRVRVIRVVHEQKVTQRNPSMLMQFGHIRTTHPTASCPAGAIVDG